MHKAKCKYTLACTSPYLYSLFIKGTIALNPSVLFIRCTFVPRTWLGCHLGPRWHPKLLKCTSRPASLAVPNTFPYPHKIKLHIGSNYVFLLLQQSPQIPSLSLLNSPTIPHFFWWPPIFPLSALKQREVASPQ